MDINNMGVIEMKGVLSYLGLRPIKGLINGTDSGYKDIYIPKDHKPKVDLDHKHLESRKHAVEIKLNRRKANKE